MPANSSKVVHTVVVEISKCLLPKFGGLKTGLLSCHGRVCICHAYKCLKTLGVSKRKSRASFWCGTSFCVTLDTGFSATLASINPLSRDSRQQDVYIKMNIKMIEVSGVLCGHRSEYAS